MLSSSLRAGINMDTKSLYALFTLVSFGFDIKLNTVTVKRRMMKNKVMDITVITVIKLFPFGAFLKQYNAAGKCPLIHLCFCRHSFQFHFLNKRLYFAFYVYNTG